jgi:alkylated DNA repair dioxygenase AlkB
MILRRWRLDHDLLLDQVRGCFTYAPDDNRATGWLDEAWIAPLQDDLEQHLGVRFTTTVFQAYRDGRAGCDWHADPSADAQAILSLGASRTLGTRWRDVEHFDRVDAGDLVYMPPGFQDDWEHCIPSEPAVTGERISLVFRT